MARLLFTVTNDLLYDQRMDRICTSLSEAGYEVELIGRKRSASLPLQRKPYRQYRLRCFVNGGPLFYLEYNVRLFFLLLFRKAGGLCAIDLDTILPVYLVSRLRRLPRVYDAHEYFTEMKEVRTRPRVQGVWKGIERMTVPHFRLGYTVSPGIARLFQDEYGVRYEVIRNLPRRRGPAPRPSGAPAGPYLLYQGAVNEGRGFEVLIPALKKLSLPLVICGDGNFMPRLKELIERSGVSDRVVLTGMLTPEALWQWTSHAFLGLTLAETEGLNQVLALPNKFFDYIQAGIPQVAMDLPEYRAVQERYPVATLLPALEENALVMAVSRLVEDKELYARLRDEAMGAAQVLHWELEASHLVSLYRTWLPLQQVELAKPQ